MKQRDWLIRVPDWTWAVWIAAFMVTAMILPAVWWPFFVWLVSFIVLSIGLIIRYIYRKAAYDYTVERIWAEVVEKEYISCRHGSDNHIVVFRTTDDLIGAIDDIDLYDWAEKGRVFKVTLRVGCSRDRRPVPKCWKVLDYSFR